MIKLKTKKALLIAAPPLLIISTYFFFQQATSLLGPQLGYFVGFLFYWLVWCLGFSLAMVGWDGFLTAFKDNRPRLTTRKWLGAVLLLVPLAFAYLYEFPRAVSEANLLIVLSSFAISIINGTAEELFWRGIYPQIYPKNKWLGYIYPSFGFAVWHFSPQSVFPSSRPGAAVSLVIFALYLGLSWGWVAFRTKSILWTTLVHIIFDFSGLGGRIYF